MRPHPSPLHIHVMGRLVDLLGAEHVSIAPPNTDTSGEALWRSLLDQAGLDPDTNAGNVALCCDGVVYPMNQSIDLKSRIEFCHCRYAEEEPETVVTIHSSYISAE